MTRQLRRGQVAEVHLINSPPLTIFTLNGIAEIQPGDDLAQILFEATDHGGLCVLLEGDILVVTSKIVSKAEGRQLPADDREQAITDQTVRVVATRTFPGGSTRIVENKQGLVMAAAGVDSSNIAEGLILLLPENPNESARLLCQQLRRRTGLGLGLIITDTVGRPWREGQTDIAIGAAGVRVINDLRGSADTIGRTLEATMMAVGDEIAGAADLVKGKTSGNPVAVVRGLGNLVIPMDVHDQGSLPLVRPSERDMFRLGTAEAIAVGYEAGVRSGEVAALDSEKTQ